MKTRGWKGTVSHTKHLGFYRINYENGILTQRNEVGAVGGRLLDRRGRVNGGIYDANGRCPYKGLPKHFSGYMHRAALTQEAYAVDPRHMQIRKELQPIYEEVFGNPMLQDAKTRAAVFKETEIIQQGIEFCSKVREAGYTVVWMPEIPFSDKTMENNTMK